jgi:tetratricopeptide (TPR) repeat protein
MAVPLSSADIAQHNEIYNEACRLQKGLLLLDQRPLPRLNFFTRRKLRKSINLFQKAIEINPTGWQSMVFIGKAHQSLNELKEALAWFARAHELVPTNSSVAKEAGKVAGELGLHDQAIQIMLPVASANPDDAALQCNLGLSCLIAGQAQAARDAFARAAVIEPERGINLQLVKLAEKIRDGVCPKPKSEAEVIRALEGL